MSSTDPFEILGLKRATATQADVKAAYAKLLKVTRPEDDRDAFMALRAAFERARQQAPKQIQATSNSAPENTTDTSPPAQPAAPVQWHFDKALGWNFDTSPAGKLAEDVIRWMIQGGPDAGSRVPQFAETLLGMPKAEADTFSERIIEYVSAAADPDGAQHGLSIWEPFNGTRPEWLNDGVIHALHIDLAILRHKPINSYAARPYNIVLDLFMPAFDQASPVPEKAASTRNYRRLASGRTTFPWSTL